MISFQPVSSREHVAAVACLAREIWPEHYAPIIGSRQVDYMLEKFQSEPAISEQLSGGYEYYLVSRDGQNVAYTALVPDSRASSMMLSKLYVKKSTRGQGLGKQILRFVEELSLKRGIKMIWLTVNKNNSPSLAWYLRMGFANAGPTIQDIGEGYIMDDFRLEKGLP
jgi:GNAT superfamily N-acetyltransferase